MFGDPPEGGLARVTTAESNLAKDCPDRQTVFSTCVDSNHVPILFDGTCKSQIMKSSKGLLTFLHVFICFTNTSLNHSHEIIFRQSGDIIQLCWKIQQGGIVIFGMCRFCL